MQSLKFSQSFGAEEERTQCAPEDEITSLIFSDNSQMFAAGDANGRVIIFSRLSSGQFSPLTECQVFKANYDALRACDVAAEVVEMAFIPRTHTPMLLACNERDVVLLGVKNDRGYQRSQYNTQQMKKWPQPDYLKLPHAALTAEHRGQPLRLYQTPGGAHVHSLCAAGDQFIVADDLSVRRYWLEDHTRPLNLVNLNITLSDRLELLTAARSHPQDQDIVACGCSTGAVLLYDFRQGGCPKPLRTELPSKVHSVEFAPPNLIFCRTLQKMFAMDVRNLGMPLLEFDMNPKAMINETYIQADAGSLEDTAGARVATSVQPHQHRFGLGLSRDKRWWAGGFVGQQIIMGSLEHDVIGFKATRQIKRSRKIEQPGFQVGAKVLMAQGQIDIDKFSSDQAGCIEKIAFGDNVLAAECAGNLFMYAW